MSAHPAAARLWRMIALNYATMNHRHTSGFTLLELMVTVTVSMILITVGVPSFLRLVAENDRASHTANVYNALNSARSEAIARNVQVVMCKSTDLSSCRTGGSWAQGWLVYANTDNAIDATEPDNPATDILLTQPELTNFALTYSTTADAIVFLSSGRSQTTGEFTLCPDDTDLEGRRIIITSTGRPRTEPVSCSTP